MAISRLKASELLNLSEMRLFDDSRPGVLRSLARAALAARVTRARAARDRARDLLKRQKQAARARGDVAGGRSDVAIRTERKEALLVDILQRFVDARRDAPATRATGGRATAAEKTKTADAGQRVKQATTSDSATKATTATRATRATKAAGTTGAARAARETAAPRPAAKTTTKKAAKSATKTAAPGGRRASKRTARLTPEKALANTRELLAAKQQRDREAQPWQSLDPETSHVPDAGYQSPEAKTKAGELHAAESRMASNHGSMGARDRHAQGRRDHRGDTD